MPGGAHAKVTGFLQEATVDRIVAVRLWTGQSALKNLIVVNRGGTFPSDPSLATLIATPVQIVPVRSRHR